MSSNPTQLRYWLKKHSQTAGDTPTRWLSLDLANAPVVIRIGKVTVEVRPGFDQDLLRVDDFMAWLNTRAPGCFRKAPLAKQSSIASSGGSG